MASWAYRVTSAVWPAGEEMLARSLMIRAVSAAGVGAEHVRQRGAHGQDQDRQAGHEGGDRPRRLRRPGLGEQAVGDLPGHAEREKTADHLANRRVRPLTACSPASQARSAYAAYASTPTGRVMAVSRCRDGQIPGSGETSPNPVFCAMPTEPDHTSAAAGAARTSSGQDRMVRPGRTAAGDRSAAGPAVPSRTGPRTPGSTAEDTSAVRAAMPVTTPPSWRAGAVRRSARPGRRRPHRYWHGRRTP
jgi:hypothetical protein